MAIPIMSQCKKMVYCLEEEQFYSKAVISSVISALLTTVDVSDPTSPIYCHFRSLIKDIISTNGFYFSTSLLYSLLFYVDASTLPMVVKNINSFLELDCISSLIHRLILQFNNRVVAKVTSIILVFVYLHDHNKLITYEVENITRSKSGLHLASMINLSSIYHFCELPADAVGIGMKLDSRL